MTTVADILRNAGSPHAEIRVPAEQQLDAAANANLAQYLLALVGVMRDESAQSDVRQRAGIVLKNTVALDAKDQDRKALLEKRWRGVDPEVRQQVRRDVLATLASPYKEVRFITALIIANLARVDLPQGEWGELIRVLCTIGAGANLEHVEPALTALGYICEECDNSDDLTDAMQVFSGDVLNTVFHALGRPDATEAVRYYGMNALCNAFDFIRPHMAVEGERSMIVNIILQCGAIAPQNTPTIRQKAFEALSRFGSLYYDVTQQYMRSIYELTKVAILASLQNGGGGDDEGVALQALEFWMTIFEVEKTKMGRQEATKGYAPYIMAELFEVLKLCLQQQQEGQTDEDWIPSVAASKCLQFLAEAVEDKIEPVVMPFVQQNIGSTNWRQREAALMAFGCILIGPSPEKLAPIVQGAIPGVLSFVDPASGNHPLVRDTGAWIMSIIANEYTEFFLHPSQFPRVLLLTAGLLKEAPAMAERGCCIIHNLAHYYDDDEEEDGAPVQSTALSPQYANMMFALFNVIDRADATPNLRSQAQEAINMLINACALDTIGALDTLIHTVIERLTRLAPHRAGGNPEVEQAISLFCGSLNATCRKLGARMVSHYPAVMAVVLNLAAVQADGSVAEEALLCIAGLASACPDQFMQYEPQVRVIVGQALQQLDDFDLCSAAIGTVGDIVSALKGAAAAAFLPPVMTVFSNHLNSPEVDRDLQINCIHCIGDISLHIGPELFHPYLAGVMAVVTAYLTQSVSMNWKDDDDDLEYCCSLWEAVSHFFTTVLQAHKKAIDPMLPHMSTIVTFINTCLPIAEQMQEDDTIEKVMSVIGDLANVVVCSRRRDIAQAAKGQLMTPLVDKSLKAAAMNPNVDIVETAQWVTKELKALSQSA